MKTLNDICELITCGVAKRPEYFKSGIPFLSSKNVKKDRFILDHYNFISELDYQQLTKYNKPEKGDILYTRVGSFGEAAVVDFDFKFAVFVSLTLIKPKHDIVHSRYLMHYLNSPEITTLAGNSTSGIGVQNLNVNVVRKFPIKLPPLETQQKIASILDAADTLRQKDKALLAKYDELTQALFLDMFGDPVSNPKGWEKVEMKQLGIIKTGNTPSRNDELNYSSNYIEWLKTDNIKQDILYVSKSKEYLSEKGLNNARFVKEGALLVACIAGSIKSIGRSALTDRKVSFNQQINAIQPNPEVESFFLYHLFKSSITYIQEFASNGMKRMLTKGVFEKIQMIKPPHEVQNQFAERVAIIEKQKAIAQASVEKSEELFNSLLQKAFKGELA